MTISTKLNLLIGSILKEKRKKLRIKQKDIAEKIGISRVYYNYIELGRVNVSIGVLHLALKELGMVLKIEEDEKQDETSK